MTRVLVLDVEAFDRLHVVRLAKLVVLLIDAQRLFQVALSRLVGLCLVAGKAVNSLVLIKFFVVIADYHDCFPFDVVYV